MLLRVGLVLATIVSVVASAANNLQHMQRFGYAVVAIVIAGELFKVFIPIGLSAHAENRHSGAWMGGLVLWCVIVVFSVLNTFGNTLTQHARDKQKQGIAAASATRPEHIILGELAGLKACPDRDETREQIEPAKGNRRARVLRVQVKVPDTECAQAVAARKLALTAELTEQKERRNRGDDATIDKNTVTDGYLELFQALGWRLDRYKVDLYTALLWTLVAELGSCLGGLTVPAWERKKKVA